ncbi:MAG TPA: hypothetical protein VLF60_03310 [Candidatus Saccharimonadales bacterium]|nr:hypothetical protein [Candidatus Saccharimonadales bacterium]
MAIIQLPSHESLPETVACAVCDKDIPLERATIGMPGADNIQRFACNGHFWNGHQLINGWVDFLVRQRFELLARGIDNGFAGEEEYARALR